MGLKDDLFCFRQSFNIADQLAWAHQKRLEARGEIEKNTEINVKTKPDLKPNPMLSLNKAPSSHDPKMKQSLTLLKSKMNRQTTFSSVKFDPAQNKMVLTKSLLKPQLKTGNYRKTFKPNFSSKPSAPVSQSMVLASPEKQPEKVPAQPVFSSTHSSNFVQSPLASQVTNGSQFSGGEIEDPETGEKIQLFLCKL